MKVKGVDLKDITIRPLPFQLPGMKSVKSVKYMRLNRLCCHPLFGFFLLD